MRTDSYILIRIQTYSYIFLHIHTIPHICKHIHTYSYVFISIHIHTSSHIFKHINAYAYMFIPGNGFACNFVLRTRLHAPVQSGTHIQTYAYTCIQSPGGCFFLFFAQYISQDSVFGKPRRFLFSSLLEIVYLEMPRRVLLLLLF